jgi:Uma2 family endonuclease
LSLAATPKACGGVASAGEANMPAAVTFGIESNGIVMTPQEFDRADFDDEYTFELVNGVVIASPLVSMADADMHEELGYFLRTYRDNHPNGALLNATLPRRYVHLGPDRRRPERVIWAGLGRRPFQNEKPTIVGEFVSYAKRDLLRDYESKRSQYESIGIAEYWLIDRFRRKLTASILEEGVYRNRVFRQRQTYRTDLLAGFEFPLSHLLELADRWIEANGEET